MAKQTKTGTKKKQTSSAKKPTLKKSANAKKPVPKKSATSARKLQTTTLKPIPKRPAVSDQIPLDVINDLTTDFTELRNSIEEFAAHMRALDRRRLNGIGIKRQGFTDRAFMLAQDNPEFLPHWLTIEKFSEDMEQFTGLRNLVDLTKQIEELLWNLTMQASDMAYTDALEFYSQIQDAARRRIDAAESPYEELHAFFRHGRRTADDPTEAEVERDIHSLLKGRKDGKVVIENIKQKLTGGKHKVIDETFKDTASFKETEEGSITE
jgi:hypothetical protein